MDEAGRPTCGPSLGTMAPGAKTSYTRGVNGIEFDRPVGDPNAALATIADAIAGQGYEITEKSNGQIKSKRKGKLITADVTQMRLLLDVTAQDGGLRFRFHTGLVASAWGDKDRQWAEQQADGWLAALG